MTGGKETNQDVLSSGERSGHRSNLKSGGPRIFRIVVLRSVVEGASSWYKSSGKGTTWRVRVPSATTAERRRSSTFRRVGLFGNAAQTGDRSHPKLNTRRRPIAKKYSDGKVIRTLKKRLKVLEIVERESSGTSICRRTILRVDVSDRCHWEA